MKTLNPADFCVGSIKQASNVIVFGLLKVNLNEKTYNDGHKV